MERGAFWSVMVAAWSVALLSCASATKPPRGGATADPSRPPYGLNDQLLVPAEGREIIFIVKNDSEHGYAEEAVQSLVDVAARYSEQPATWVAPDDPRFVDFVFDRRGKPGCAREPLIAGAAYVLIRFVDSERGAFGWADREPVKDHCGARALYTITVNQAQVASLAILWLTAATWEERALIHEYGHLLRLGYNPAHSDPASESHCVNPHCVFARPTDKAVVHTLLQTGVTFENVREYCNDCRADIEAAKELWGTEDE